VIEPHSTLTAGEKTSDGHGDGVKTDACAVPLVAARTAAAAARSTTHRNSAIHRA
jgi:hypothetical protein